MSGLGCESTRRHRRNFYNCHCRNATLADDVREVNTESAHSTRSIEEFIRLLKAHSVTCVADVRTVPRSRHNPQFNRDTLPTSLEEADIGYTHIAGLGGLRRPKSDSINTGWRNASFRGYADYMQTPEFETSLEVFIELAKKDRVAVMCAEAVPWRCHRSMIADALVARGIPVEHIMSETRCDSHSLRTFAKRTGIHLTYPPESAEAELSQATIPGT
jgi:uncharacterized protein (DUF488 family)